MYQNNPFISILVLFFLIFSLNISAQSEFIISGQVLDSTNNDPLIRALIYISPSESSDFLAYGNTDESGNFTLKVVVPGDTSLKLHFSYLGFHQKVITISPSEEFTNRVIKLSPKENLINEVIVADKKSSITQKSDTTSYDLAEFLDSTEYNVEDILKKLPGIEVQDDGSIKVNGKEISKVLIEGDDLFGKKYQIGTRNIRSGYIGRVEVIDRFQDNPVLKNVNTSEDIVVNLFIKEDKKYTLNGTYDISLGAGLDPALKGGLRANIFSINKTRKAILLADNTNFGNQYSVSELDLMYDNFDSRDIKNNPFTMQQQQVIKEIQNPGLNPIFIDNSFSYFNTIRFIEKLNPQWTLNANAILAGKNGRQTSFYRQSYFLDQDSYDISEQSNLHLKRLTMSGNVFVNNIAKNQKKSFQVYAEWDQSRRRNEVDNILSRENTTIDYKILEEMNPLNVYIAGLYSQQLRENSVLQLQVRAAAKNNPQFLLSDNVDYSMFFLEDPSLANLRQQMNFKHQNLDLLIRYIRTFDNVIAELDMKGSTEILTLKNYINLKDLETNDNADVLMENDTISSDNLQMNAKIRINSKKGFFQFNLKGAIVENKNLTINEDFKDLAGSFYAGWNRELTRSTRINLAYFYSENNPDGFDFVRTPYFTNALTFRNSSFQNRREGGHSTYLTYYFRDIYNYFSGNVSLKYQFNQNYWLDQTNFISSIAVFEPFFSTGNSNLSISTLWDYYLKSSKVRIGFKGSYSNGFSNLPVEEEEINFGNESYKGEFDITKVFFGSFRTTIKTGYAHRINFDGANKSQTMTSIRIWNNGLFFTYNVKGWIAEANVQSIKGGSDLGNSINLLSTQLGIRNEISVNSRKMMLGLNVNNLLNTREYTTTTNDTLFLFESGVNALPAFFVFNVDYSF